MKRFRRCPIPIELNFLLIAVALALPNAASGESIEFADSAHVDDWFRHPVFGDPSFDSVERLAGNPVFRGAAPLAWPVNGFFSTTRFRAPLVSLSLAHIHPGSIHVMFSVLVLSRRHDLRRKPGRERSQRRRRLGRSPR